MNDEYSVRHTGISLLFFLFIRIKDTEFKKITDTTNLDFF